jgi:hypothetical protein
MALRRCCTSMIGWTHSGPDRRRPVGKSAIFDHGGTTKRVRGLSNDLNPFSSRSAPSRWSAGGCREAG